MVISGVGVAGFRRRATVGVEAREGKSGVASFNHTCHPRQSNLLAFWPVKYV